jgi:hypothetical protein
VKKVGPLYSGYTDKVDDDLLTHQYDVCDATRNEFEADEHIDKRVNSPNVDANDLQLNLLSLFVRLNSWDVFYERRRYDKLISLTEVYKDEHYSI